MRFHWTLLANFLLAACGSAVARSPPHPTLKTTQVSVSSVSEQVLSAVETQNAAALDRSTVRSYEFQDRSGLEWKPKASAVLAKLRGCEGKILDVPGGFLQGTVGRVIWTCGPGGRKSDPCLDPVYTGSLFRFSNGYLLRLVDDTMFAAYECRASQH